MSSETYCVSCNNSCQSCNTCQSCNATCNAESGCNSQQTFCPSKQVYSTLIDSAFSFSQCAIKNEIICKLDEEAHFNRSVWNEIVTYINSAFDEGTSPLTDNSDGGTGGIQDGSKGGDSGVTADTTNLFITAAQFVKIAGALDSLGGHAENDAVDTLTTLKSVKKNDVIYGHYFESLEEYANSLKLKDTQCDDCNAGCNVTCNLCQKCNSGCQDSCDIGSHTDTTCCGCDSSCESEQKAEEEKK